MEAVDFLDFVKVDLDAAVAFEKEAPSHPAKSSTSSVPTWNTRASTLQRNQLASRAS